MLGAFSKFYGLLGNSNHLVLTGKNSVTYFKEPGKQKGPFPEGKWMILEIG